ncbi:MAG: hypothetical protein DGJ47_000649, partial [Rickettsiaceae bacterium]
METKNEDIFNVSALLDDLDLDERMIDLSDSEKERARVLQEIQNVHQNAV